MSGGDLRFHLDRRTFTEDAIGFWIAELACAIEYIHTQAIVHRDIKPENILLGADGHVSLADFNIATRIPPHKVSVTSSSSTASSFSSSTSARDDTTTSRLVTVSGTMAYLAPEVYGNSGYGTATDWWALGVVMYECIYGRRPFPSSHHNKLRSQIIAAKPSYPKTSPPVSNEALQAIAKLLKIDPLARLGSTGPSIFFEEPFFGKYTRDGLEKKIFSPIFVPSSVDINYDKTYEMEELLFADRLDLHNEHRSSKKDRPRTSIGPDITKEEEIYLMMEKHFVAFDFTAPSEKYSPESISHVQSSSSVTYAEHPAHISPPGLTSSHSCSSDSLDSDDNTVNSQQTNDIASSSPTTPDSIHSSMSALTLPVPNSVCPVPIKVFTTTTLTDDIDNELTASLDDEPKMLLRKKTFAPIPQRYTFNNSVIETTSPLSALDLAPKEQRDSSLRTSQNTSHHSHRRQRSHELESSNSHSLSGSVTSLAKQLAERKIGSADRNDFSCISQPDKSAINDIKRKRGRNHSPRPTERGVLGKEGARIILKN